MGIATLRLHRQRYGELAELRLGLRLLAKLHEKGLRTRALVLEQATRDRLHVHGFDTTEIEGIRFALGLPKSGSPAA